MTVFRHQSHHLISEELVFGSQLRTDVLQLASVCSVILILLRHISDDVKAHIFGLDSHILRMGSQKHKTNGEQSASTDPDQVSIDGAGDYWQQ